MLINAGRSVFSSALLAPAAPDVAAGELYGTMIVGMLAATVAVEGMTTLVSVISVIDSVTS